MKNIFIKSRRAIYSFLYKIDKIFGRELDVVVLCYHDISRTNWEHSILPSKFQRQVSYLAENYNFISIDDLRRHLYRGKKLPEKSVLITFDDGCNCLLNISDYLFEKGAKPVAFVLSDRDNADLNQIGLRKKKILKDSQIKKLNKLGWEIGSHSATHRDFYSLNSKEIVEETKGSVKKLEKMIDKKIKYFAYPRGRYNDEIVNRLLETNVKIAFSMDDSSIKRTTNKYRVPRVGISATHSFEDFKASFSPSVVFIRSLIKPILNLYYGLI